jgi:hypothetical protein
MDEKILVNTGIIPISDKRRVYAFWASSPELVNDIMPPKSNDYAPPVEILNLRSFIARFPGAVVDIRPEIMAEARRLRLID